VAERRALLQRVLWSPQIAKSSRIREFLEYVCQQALLDPSAEIHEQEIGCRVFGRRPDYDTAIDNVVRVTASQARKKLEQYFSAQGATEPCILEIPKGGYTPVFRERDMAPDTTEPPQQQTPGRLTASRPLILLAIGVPWLLVVAGCLYWMFWNAPKSAPSGLNAYPSLEALWSQLLSRGGRTDVVVTDSGLSLSQELQPRQLTLPEYLERDFWSRDGSLTSDRDLRSFVERMGQRRLTSIGSVTTAFRVAELAGGSQTRVSIISPRDFNIHQMKTDNVVLLGSSIANPWVSLLEDRLTFRFGFDRVSRFAYFENREPRPGELKTYRTDSDVSYCQIAFLPNLAQTGNVLAISGAEVEGTEGGGEYVTSEHSLNQLRSLMKLGTSRFPYFEVLLKSSKVGGSTPGFVPVAFRILRP
jgi:hypothetical protein